jgi:hypothetical protein
MHKEQLVCKYRLEKYIDLRKKMAAACAKTLLAHFLLLPVITSVPEKQNDYSNNRRNCAASPIELFKIEMDSIATGCGLHDGHF